MRSPALLSRLVPARCPICRGGCDARQRICRSCARRLAVAAPVAPRIVRGMTVASARPYRGTARDLILAMKFRDAPGLAALAAEIILESCELRSSVTLVPVAADPVRRRLRGYDPAALIAAELSRLTGARHAACLGRGHGPPQVGRERAARIAGPAGGWITAGPPVGAVILVDDVLTTGATIAAGVGVLRRAGVDAVGAITFASSPGRLTRER